MAAGNQNIEEMDCCTFKQSENKKDDEDVFSSFWSARAADRLLACLGYDRVKTSEDELGLLFKLTKMVDQVEQASDFTKSIGRKKCYTRLVKHNFDVDKTIASLFHEEEMIMKLSRRRVPGSTQIHLVKDNKIPHTETNPSPNTVAKGDASDCNETFCISEDASGDDRFHLLSNAEDAVLSLSATDVTVPAADPMLTSTPQKDDMENGSGLNADGLDVTTIASPDNVNNTFTLQGKDGNAFTVTVAINPQPEPGTSLEQLPFESVNDKQHHDSSGTLLDETDDYQSAVFMTEPGAQSEQLVKGDQQIAEIKEISYDQILPPVIFESDQSLTSPKLEEKDSNLEEKAPKLQEEPGFQKRSTVGGVSSIDQKEKPKSRTPRPVLKAKDHHTGKKSSKHAKKFTSGAVDVDPLPHIEPKELTDLVNQHEAAKTVSKMQSNATEKTIEELQKEAEMKTNNNDHAISQKAKNKSKKFQKPPPEAEEVNDAKAVGAVSKQNEKRKRRSNISTSSPRDFIVHGQPREIEEALPLALTYGTEPKTATHEEICCYIQKYYPSANLDMLPVALDDGIKVGSWSKENDSDKSYQLLIKKIQSDSDMEGMICNAILACNKPKWARFPVLKDYIIDFHSDVFGVTAKNIAPLKKALERALANNLIRIVGAKTRALAMMRYELVPEFIPSPVILQGDDIERDYLEFDNSQKLRWTPVMV